MMKTLKLVAGATALLASVAAQAASPLLQMNTYNGSLAFVAVDNVGTPTSIAVDLGFTLNGHELNSFDPQTMDAAARSAVLTQSPSLALWQTAGTRIQWNFVDNTVLINGAAQAGTHSYNSAYNFFQGNAQPAETRWGVVAGATGNFPNYWLSTGNPTAIQLAAQTADLTTNFDLTAFYTSVNNHPNNATGVNTLLSTTGAIGASAVANETLSASGYLLGGLNMGAQGDWGTQAKFTALTSEGATNTSPLWFLTDGTDGMVALSGANGAGQFSYSQGVLTYAVPSAVPEPGIYALFAAGLLSLAGLRRRIKS